MSRLTFSYFSGARDGTDPIYHETAEKLGQWMGGHDVHVKYGGSSSGLMGAFCRGFVKASQETCSGGTIEGILPKKYQRVNQPESLGIPFTLTEGLTERKHLLLDNVDAFLVLPGGTGTLDEIYECVEQDYLPMDRDPTVKSFGIRPIFVLNLNNYYQHTKDQLEHMVKNGFVSEGKLATLSFIDDFEVYKSEVEKLIKTV